MVKIKFHQAQKELNVSSGSEFLDIPGLPIQFGCKHGTCGTCSIRILCGMENLTKISPREGQTLKQKDLDPTHRLACQCAINGPVEIF
ncbi:MAG: hypothetical protein BGO14_02380 [Chlamydiales bacterium 38-26]|nr:(2Fe-2S)-binding protein [Chlamydiales bacterium]OJV08282.1 MAG: hypothetical protein BGO14_02380 [Chlamydiales bacterium 38-26]